MEPIEIRDLMLGEHVRINHFLNEFEKNLRNSKEDNQLLFDRFKWSLEKHFFVEEKAIFAISQNLFGNEISDIFDLMDQHGIILELIKPIEKGIRKNIPLDISKLKEDLMNHAEFEDDVFYPKLDKMLNKEQKQEIILRIKEAVR
jgi:iron-sulfur cluster repair protein YtfE (RIC family)